MNDPNRSVRAWVVPRVVARRDLVLVAVVAAAMAMTGCGRTAPARTNLLLVTLDTTRADRLSCYGSKRPITRNLDALAARGLLFEAAYTPTPLTLPAHATILTGALPSNHGVTVNGEEALGEGFTTLAETLRGSGYRTAAFVSSFVLEARFGLDQGFEVYDDALPPGPAGAEGPERTAGDVVDAAIAWLDDLGERPFFLWVHFFDPHTPYTPPEPYRRAHPDDPYAGEIAYMDGQIGRLLAALESEGRRETTLVVAAGDHGESLGEKGEDAHGVLLHQAVVRVPLLIAGPGLGDPRRVRDVVSLADLRPTLTRALLGSTEPAIDGVSLDLSGASATDRTTRPIFLESWHPFRHYGWSPIAGVVRGDWKLLVSTRADLFDLASDPGETRSLTEEHSEIASSLRASLDTYLNSARARFAPRSVTLTDEERLRLAALGYRVDDPAASEASPRNAPPAPSAWPSLPDPRERIGVVRRFAEAARALEGGHFDRAAEIYRTILESEPRNARALNGLGVCLLQQDDAAEARRLLEQAVAIDPRLATAQGNLGAAQDRLGLRAEAAQSYRRALALDPEQEAAARNLALLYLEANETEKALAAFRLQDSIAPDRPETLAWIARCEETLGNVGRALEATRRILAILPDSSFAHYQTGRLLLRLGSPDEAFPHLERARDLDPSEPRIWFELGRAAIANGRLEVAREAVEKLERLDAQAAEMLRREIR